MQTSATAVYRPAAPPEAERRFAELQQLLRLPWTLRRLYAMVREEFTIAALDEYLWSFWGFHQEPWDLHYRMRPWQKAQLRAIGPGDVTGLAVWELALMFNIAMEDEEPILEYSQQSGEGFRFLLPTLGRYMGSNEEQARFARENSLPWCEGPWCAEERRHSNTLARMIARLMKQAPARDNPNRPMVVTSSEADALQHLLSRQTTEWNASSSYAVMGAHSEGELYRLVVNLARDEIKHLAILSAANAYLFGHRPWRRFFDVVRKGIENYRLQRRNRSGGGSLGANPVTAVEGIAAHLMTEWFLRRWIGTVPLRSLRMVFETPSSLPELGAVEAPAERRAEIEETLERGREARLALRRWAAGQRSDALKQERYEGEHAEEVEEAIARELGGFRGAERPGSMGDRAARARIQRVRGVRRLRAALLGCLRDYQIRNNRHVIPRGVRDQASGRR